MCVVVGECFKGTVQSSRNKYRFWPWKTGNSRPWFQPEHVPSRLTSASNFPWWSWLSHSNSLHFSFSTCKIGIIVSAYREFREVVILELLVLIPIRMVCTPVFFSFPKSLAENKSRESKGMTCDGKGLTENGRSHNPPSSWWRRWGMSSFPLGLALSRLETSEDLLFLGS